MNACNVKIAAAFGMGLVLMDSIEKAQSLNTDKICKEIETNSFPTCYRNLSFVNHQSEFELLVLQIQSDLSAKIVFPSTVTEVNITYPIPLWKVRECEYETSFCNSYGVCSPDGVSICNAGYYGDSVSSSCSHYCDGVLNENKQCIRNQLYFIGAILDYSLPRTTEVISSLNLAVNLINNKTDSWFDDSAAQVKFKLIVNNSYCNPKMSHNITAYQIDWAVKEGSELSAIIGDDCSLSSTEIASANSARFLQISHSSVADVLGNKELYPFFARVSSAASTVGRAISSALISMGVLQYIAVVNTIDSNSQLCSEALVSR